MKISIHEPFKPFSHLPGTEFLLPGSFFSIKIFPCKLCVFDQRNNPPNQILEACFDFQGPLKQFTVINDLDRGRISVSGETKQGWVRYHLKSGVSSQGVECVFNRVPAGKQVEVNGKKIEIVKEKPLVFLCNKVSFSPYQVPLLEKLFLGNHKAQDVEMIRRRGDLTEIFPLLFRSGQLIFDRSQGDFAHFNKEAWGELFLRNFSFSFVPRLDDLDCQGIAPSNMALKAKTPLELLRAVMHLIRHHFFIAENSTLIVLPHLLPEFHSGHFLDGLVSGLGKIRFEWTKKCIRRLEISATETVESTLDFKSPIHSCRVRQREQDKGIVYHNRTPISIEKGCIYFFDNFQ